jgi:hypothetical protein
MKKVGFFVALTMSLIHSDMKYIFSTGSKITGSTNFTYFYVCLVINKFVTSYYLKISRCFPRTDKLRTFFFFCYTDIIQIKERFPEAWWIPRETLCIFH